MFFKRAKPSLRTCTPAGETIRRLRQEKGWTQEDLASQAGVSLRTISSLETGKKTLPCTIKLCAKALGVEPLTLILKQDKLTIPKSNASEFCITLHISLSDIDLTTDLIARLSAEIHDWKLQNQIDVHDIEEGTIRLYCLLTIEDAVRIIVLEQLNFRYDKYHPKPRSLPFVNNIYWPGIPDLQRLKLFSIADSLINNTTSIWLSELPSTTIKRLKQIPTKYK